MSFDTALKIILRNEGVRFEGDVVKSAGYANDVDDPGGETKWGVSMRAWLTIRHSRPDYAYYPENVRDLTLEQASAIYKTEYWSAAGCEGLPSALALIHFDAAVNMGVETAIKLLQRAVRVRDDGVLGPVTRRALPLGTNREGVAAVLEEALWQRMREYAAIVQRKPKLVKFLAGWTIRVVSLRAAAYERI